MRRAPHTTLKFVNELNREVFEHLSPEYRGFVFLLLAASSTYSGHFDEADASRAMLIGGLGRSFPDPKGGDDAYALQCSQV